MAKLLKRVKNNSMLGGVCTGLGKYFDVDPFIWRLVFIFGTTFFVPAFILTYAIMWIIVPKEEEI